MSTTTMVSAASNWGAVKPRLLFLVIGLIAGPEITNVAGWQITSLALQRHVHAAIVAQQALFCEAKARAEVQGTIKLDRIARTELAEKSAVMPGATTTNIDVVRACANKLAR
jgi:hypothetical protein